MVSDFMIGMTCLWNYRKISDIIRTFFRKIILGLTFLSFRNYRQT